MLNPAALNVSDQCASDTQQPLGWEAQARCQGMNTDEFFEPASTAHAIGVCSTCPVREPCLASALDSERGLAAAYRAGVRGGVSARKRAALDDTVGRNRKPGGRPLAPCGTEVAYQRHHRNGEPIDAACRDGHAAYNASRRVGAERPDQSVHRDEAQC